MATLLKVLNNLADIKSAGVLHFASELRANSSRGHSGIKVARFDRLLDRPGSRAVDVPPKRGYCSLNTVPRKSSTALSVVAVASAE
jgi:hypothetical protein